IALCLDFPSHVTEARGDDYGRNASLHQFPDNRWHMPIELDLIQKALDLRQGTPFPQPCVAPAKFVVRNLARKPLVQVYGCHTLPEPQSLVNVPPWARRFGQGPIEIEDDCRNHLCVI